MSGIIPVQAIDSVTVVAPLSGATSALDLRTLTVQLITPTETGDPAAANARIYYDRAERNYDASPYLANIVVTETPAQVAAKCSQVIALTERTLTTTHYLHAGLIVDIVDNTTYRTVRWASGKYENSIEVTETETAIKALTQAAGSGGGSVVPFTGTAWVRAGGNDGTAQVGDLNLPYLTVQGAIDAVTALPNGGEVIVGAGATWPSGSTILKTNASVTLLPEVRFLEYAGTSAMFSDAGVSVSGATLNLGQCEIQLTNALGTIASFTAAGTNIDIDNGTFLRGASTATSLWNINNGTARVRLNDIGIIGVAAEVNPLFTLIDGTAILRNCRIWHQGVTGDAVYIDNAGVLTGGLQITTSQIQTSLLANSVNSNGTHTVTFANSSASSITGLNITNQGTLDLVLGLTVA